MPKVSKNTAERVEDMGAFIGHYGEMHGYTVGFEEAREDVDGTAFFKGLPDDRCQSPHWGYVISGRLTLKFADRDEAYEAGDAYYAPPGHVPVVAAGTQVVEFSPTDSYNATMAVVAENFAAGEGE